MLDQQTVDKKKPSGSRHSDDNQKPDDRARERVVRRFFDSLLEDPDDPMICRGID
jgi:hypothetical protein